MDEHEDLGVLDDSTRYRLFAFDLDDTLSESKVPIAPEMAEALAALLAQRDVLVITGAALGQIESQVLAHLPATSRWAGLHVMPTCGARYLRRTDDRWDEVYSTELGPGEVARIAAEVEAAARALGLWVEDGERWGEAIEDRGSQVTYSALGQRAPTAAKSGWDPTGERRGRLQAVLADRLPEYDVRRGGSTSVDVTLRGIDKAHGVGRAIELLGLDVQDVVFFGDQLDEGGNDHPVLGLGVRCVQVRDWHDTRRHVLRAAAELAASALHR